jgi:MinD-like ATPase involved in chromosome partitioning or flagellar assembly
MKKKAEKIFKTLKAFEKAHLGHEVLLIDQGTGNSYTVMYKCLDCNSSTVITETNKGK